MRGQVGASIEYRCRHALCYHVHGGKEAQIPARTKHEAAISVACSDVKGRDTQSMRFRPWMISHRYCIYISLSIMTLGGVPVPGYACDGSDGKPNGCCGGVQ